MEAQFRCKCGKAMAYANERCPDCGSLGPHSFMGKGVPVAESTDIPEPARHRESHASEYVDRREPAVSPDLIPPAEDHISDRMPHSGGRAFEENDSSFPAGMRSHSPMLDHIRILDSDQIETKKHPGKSAQSRHLEEEERHPAYPYDNDEGTAGEKEQAQPPDNGRIVSTIISVVLVLALLIATIYVINNFEEITKWLASPTVPEYTQPPVE